MNNIAFGFDLHNTILKSNDAWIAAYVELLGSEYEKTITYDVYRKKSRKKLAETYNIKYEDVYRLYREKVMPDKQMIQGLYELRKKYPVYLISSASEKKVYKDLSKIECENIFEKVLTKEIFNKNSKEDWINFLNVNGIDLLVYIGNDVDEDVIGVEGVLSLVSGDFLSRLNSLNLLMNRARWNND